MNETIRKRKSIRKFDMTALDEATLEKVQSFAMSAKPLFADINYTIELTEKTKGLGNIKAPHYLIFKSETTDSSQENIGFIGQQIDLFLAENGLGSCWLGLSKPTESDTAGLPYVICIAFGKPAEPLYRDISTFKRKQLNAISEGNDLRLEAARLAPSGLNGQHWFFVAESNKIHCYRRKLGKITGAFLDKIERIDIGIAICHIAVESDNFSFTPEDNAPEKKGFIYVGTVS